MPKPKGPPTPHSHPHLGTPYTLTSAKPKGQPQCHTCGLHWQAPRGTTGRGHWHFQSNQHQPPTNTHCPRQKHHQGNFHGHKGAAPSRHDQRQVCPAQVPIPMTMLMHHCHCQSRLGATSDPASSKTGAPPEHFPRNQGPGAEACPTINHQFSPTKMVFRGPADCVSATHNWVNDF